jgi:arylsulfatase A-like enzyme
VPSRRRIRRRARAAPALAAALALLVAACGRAPSGPRNAVAICLDTVRFDTFWLPERADLDDPFRPWAERALRFRRAYAPAPWTLPSVASFLTGVYPARHGAGSYRGSEDTLKNRLPPPLHRDFRTLPELLRLRGYVAHAIVRQAFFHPSFGLTRGFDRVEYAEDRDDLLARTRAWLDERQRRTPQTPFLLYLHFLEAHQQHVQGPERVRELAAEMDPAVAAAAAARAPAGACDVADSDACRVYQVYAMSVLHLRQAVAQLLDDLEARGLLERTLVVLYSDHGEEFGDHLAEERARGSDRRGIYGIGHGQSLYAELLHVPLLVWHPERTGRDVEGVTSLVDAAPTLAAWLGERELDADWDGRSALGADARAPGEGRPVFASEIAFGPEESAVIEGRWKRVRRTGPSERLLFDLAADPREARPLRDPRVEGRLDALLEGYEASARAPGAAAVELRPDEIGALRELGYLEDLPED